MKKNVVRGGLLEENVVRGNLLEKNVVRKKCCFVNFVDPNGRPNIQGVPKKRTIRMLLEPQCTGSIAN